MGHFIATLTNEQIENNITILGGRFFFNSTSLTGAAWANLEAMVAELEERTGEECAGRYDAQFILAKGQMLMLHKPADFGA